MNQPYNPFDHPLVEGTILVETQEGKQEETVNCYTFAAMILDVITNPLSPVENPQGFTSAITMAEAAIVKSNSNINVSKLINKCQQGNQAALMQAQTLIATGLEILIDEQFKLNGYEK